MSNEEPQHTIKASTERKPNPWNVRAQLGSPTAMRAYDAYLTEHKRRLRQLEKEARGEMSPSGDWYR